MASPTLSKTTTHLPDDALLIADLKASLLNKTSDPERKAFCRKVLQVLTDVVPEVYTDRTFYNPQLNQNWRTNVQLSNVVKNESTILSELKHTPALHKALVETGITTYDTLLTSDLLSLEEIKKLDKKELKETLKIKELTDLEKNEILMGLIKPEQIEQLKAVLQHKSVNQSRIANLM
ncbi:hypothetical protein [Kistimonas asteriae]|uniref:hypothetical protein n=1 Tax=Kistimonas asteriae TaxID=517724 RepID=UPI001BAB57AC|nr:hypothetical protein [Kistimonas asteriae]